MTAADRFLLRPLSPLDRRAVVFWFGRLGAGSRNQRFLAQVRELSPVQLERMVQVDHWHHEVVIAYSPVPRMPIGVAEYVRLKAFDEAELAVAVVDDWQRRGVGSALACALSERALNAGIRRFTAAMLRGNGGALAVARTLGRVELVGGQRDAAELRVQLSASSPSHDRAARATASRSAVRL
jgi:RimJ/RimL family protein N-acetyltransferase